MVEVKEIQRLIRLEIHEVVLPNEPISKRAKDSLELMYLIQAIENEYEVNLPDDQLNQLTPEKIVEIINANH